MILDKVNDALRTHKHLTIGDKFKVFCGQHRLSKLFFWLLGYAIYPSIAVPRKSC